MGSTRSSGLDSKMYRVALPRKASHWLIRLDANLLTQDIVAIRPKIKALRDIGLVHINGNFVIQQLAQRMINSFASALGWRAANMLPPWLVWVLFCIGAVVVVSGKW